MGIVIDSAPLSCCSQQVCASCARRWATLQASEQGANELTCPSCTRTLCDNELLALLDPLVLRLVRMRRCEVMHVAGRVQPSEEDLGLRSGQLAKLGAKRCPACGTGMQKDVETCHKMICRTCRAKFCFRCLARLEYFNCGCTAAEHRFVYPIDGRTVAHQ